jgi:hypothetical protein
VGQGCQKLLNLGGSFAPRSKHQTAHRLVSLELVFYRPALSLHRATELLVYVSGLGSVLSWQGVGSARYGGAAALG